MRRAAFRLRIDARVGELPVERALAIVFGADQVFLGRRRAIIRRRLRDERGPREGGEQLTAVDFGHSGDSLPNERHRGRSRE